MTDEELIEHLRREASIGFNIRDILLLEELIRRYRRLQKESQNANSSKTSVE